MLYTTKTPCEDQDPEDIEIVSRTCKTCGAEFQGTEWDFWCSGTCSMAASRAFWDDQHALRRAAFSYVIALCGGRGGALHGHQDLVGAGMTTIGIQRLIIHHILAAWEARKESRQRPTIKEWCDGQRVAHLNTVEYLRGL